MHILLTDPSGSKKLVNMTLVSEAVPVAGQPARTNLVVASAVDFSNSLVVVQETPEQIDKLLRLRRAGVTVTE